MNLPSVTALMSAERNLWRWDNCAPDSKLRRSARSWISGIYPLIRKLEIWEPHVFAWNVEIYCNFNKSSLLLMTF